MTGDNLIVPMDIKTNKEEDTSEQENSDKNDSFESSGEPSALSHTP